VTEQEYVEFIHSKAVAYVVEISKISGDRVETRPITEWEHVKSMLSAHTLVDLCDNWLKREKHEPEKAKVEAE
jgi:hypothetical protein